MSLHPKIAAFLAAASDAPAPASLEAIRLTTDSGLRALHGPLDDAAGAGTAGLLR